MLIINFFTNFSGYMNPNMYSRYDMSPASAPSMSSSPYLNGSYAMYASSTTPVGSSSGGGNSGGTSSNHIPAPSSPFTVSSAGSGSVSPSPPKHALSPYSSSSHGGGGSRNSNGGGSISITNNNNNSIINGNRSNNNAHFRTTNNFKYSPATSPHLMSSPPPPPTHFTPGNHYQKGYLMNLSSGGSRSSGGGPSSNHNDPHGIFPGGHPGGDLRQMISMYLPPHHQQQHQASLEGSTHSQSMYCPDSPVMPDEANNNNAMISTS